MVAVDFHSFNSNDIEAALQRLSAVSFEEATQIATSLLTDPSFTTLQLIGKQISDSSQKLIVDALVKTSSLISLELTNQSAIAVIERIKEVLSNPYITSINLTANTIGGFERVRGPGIWARAYVVWRTQQGIGQNKEIEIAEALSTNTTLTFLDLSNNHIKGEGAIAIAQALSTEPVFRTVDLSDNVIGIDGGIEILKAIQEYPNNVVYIKNNHFQGTRIEEEIIEQNRLNLERAYRKVTSLYQMILDANPSLLI